MKEIPKIASKGFARNLKLLKMAYKGGKNLLKNRDDWSKEKLSEVLSSQVHSLVNDMGLMKGPIMKMGQLLSIYSDGLLPEEFQKVIQQLENKSFYLSWNEIKKNIDPNYFDLIEIESTPQAAASLGQVHKAKIKESNEIVAIKIQYKGVRKAINNDIKVLKLLLKLSEVVPSEKDYSGLFEEIKTMLYQETDYRQEKSFTDKYRDQVSDLNYLYVPKTYEKFCNDKILTTEFIEGVGPRDILKLELSQDQINQLGEQFFDHFFKEIFQWGVIQTDAHAGNYLIRKHENNVQWVLLDFGACKEPSEQVRELYRKFIKATVYKDYQSFIDTLIEVGFISAGNEKSYDLIKSYVDIVGSPFKDEVYDWGKSEIPDQVLKFIPKLIKEFSNDTPPGDNLFIDRKIGGVFFLLKMINASFNPNKVIEKYI